MAIARSATLTCSPVFKSTSSSRLGGESETDFAKPIRRSVSPDMADRITMVLLPSPYVFTTRCATLKMRSMVPMLVPPYFCTIRAI